MKFIDTFTEDDKKKLIKKAKLIFSVLKKGTITRSDGVSFSYILGDNMKPIVVNGEIEIFAFISKIVEKTYCPLSINAIKELILKKFKHFDIEAELYQTPSTQIEKYQGKKPWEKDELNEEGRLVKKQDPNEEKRVKTIFKAFRKGVIKVQHPRTNEIIKFRYYINDPVFFTWEYYNMMEQQLTIITNNFPGEGITIYCDDKDVVDKCTNDIESISKNPTGIHLREMFMNKLKRKFDNLDVSFYINERGMKFVLGEPTELNEEVDIDKERKRVKTIHKAIRKGIVNLSDGKYRYELPENYKFYLMDNEMINIKFTFNNHDLGQNFAGVGLPLRVWRIEDGKDVFLNGILSKDDVSDIVYGDDYLLNTKSGVDYTNVKNKIRNKYRDFNINAIMTSPSDNPMDLTPMVNEGAEVIDSEGLTDKDIKKVKTLYKLLKKGHFKYDDHSTYGYILPEDYHIYKDELGDVCIKLTGEEEIKMVSKVRFSRPSDNFDLPILPQHTGLRGWIKTKVMEKFEGFNIKFIF